MGKRRRKVVQKRFPHIILICQKFIQINVSISYVWCWIMSCMCMHKIAVLYMLCLPYGWVKILSLNVKECGRKSKVSILIMFMITCLVIWPDCKLKIHAWCCHTNIMSPLIFYGPFIFHLTWYITSILCALSCLLRSFSCISM